MAQVALIGLMIAGGVMSAIGNVREANAQADAAEYQAKRDEELAWQTKQAYADEEERERANNLQTLASVRAQYGASGVTMEGSPTDFMEFQSAVAEENALKIRHEGLLKAKQYSDNATYLRKQAGDIRTSGIINAIGSGVSTAGQIMKRT